MDVQAANSFSAAESMCLAHLCAYPCALPTTFRCCSSFMLNIDNLDADEVTLTFYAATNKPLESGNPGVSTFPERMVHNNC